MMQELFILLRAGLQLSEITSSEFQIIESLDIQRWRKIMALAKKHGVSAMAFDGYQKIFEGKTQPLDTDCLMDWMWHISFLERRNKQQLENMKAFCGRLIHDGCTVMLIKGQANALYYPKPLYRSTGDIDIYMFDSYEKGNQLAKEYGAKVDDHWYKHTQIHYMGEMFENHSRFVHTREGKRSKLLDVSIKETLNEEKCETFPDSGILLPPVMFCAKFLTYHAFAHFISEGLLLKQVVDWVMFLNKEKDRIDWKQLYSFVDKFYLRRFLDVMNDIAAHQFGVILPEPVVTTNSPYTERVLNSIFYDDDFVFGSGKGSWHNRFHLISNMWKYRWKYRDIYQMSIFRQLYYYIVGFVFHTE